MRGTSRSKRKWAVGAVLAAALTVGSAVPAGAQGMGKPTNPWAGHGGDQVAECGDGGIYHWVLNQYTGDPEDFRINGEEPSKITRGTVHWHITMDPAPEPGDVEVITNGELAEGGLVLSDCVPDDDPPLPPS